MNKEFFFIFSLLISCNLWATDSREEFCQKLIQSNQKSSESVRNKDVNSRFGQEFNLVINALFTPNSIVDMEKLDINQIERNQILDSDMVNKKYVFLFVREEKLSIEEKKELKTLKRKLKKRQKFISNMTFTRNLLEVTDTQQCLDNIEQNEEDYLLVIDFSRELSKSQPLFEKGKEAKMYELTISKMKFLQREGWEIIKDASFYQANQIMNTGAHSALFITHSTKAGKIIDAKGNNVPKHFFTAIPNSVKKVIMYSCHSEAVIKHYSVNSKKRHFEYHYPIVKEKFQFMFNSKVPLVSLKKIKKALKSKVNQTNRLNMCPITVNTDHSSAGYSLYLNRSYIGSFDKKKKVHDFTVDCNSLNTANYFSIYRTKDESVDTSNDRFNSIRINDDLVGKFENYYSRINNNHIVSKFKLTLTKDKK